jgi:hypothetical protein
MLVSILAGMSSVGVSETELGGGEPFVRPSGFTSAMAQCLRWLTS